MSEQPIPEKPGLDGLENKWSETWESNGVYSFDRTKERSEVFSIDTPPPTVSGSLHIGHVFSYTQTDAIARYQRMKGKEVFYPMGWDDNGLPTERRVQNVFGVACDPTLPYDPNFVAPEPLKKKGERPTIRLSRQNFIELCETLTTQDEATFEQLWRRLGLSVDWSMTYTTIGKAAQRTSQRAFLRNLARNEAYQALAPTMWDVDFQTAVAQAEMEDRDVPAAYHRLAFRHGEEIVPVDTTRPELLAACVGVVVHPDDERYKHLHGKEISTALFGARVTVQPHHLADPEKGTGAVMVCTFGDMTDVIWWREFSWPTRTIMSRNGRLGELDWSAIPGDRPDFAAEQYRQLTGLKSKPAQEKIVELLSASGELIGEPRKITHPVKFFEKGDKPLEIVTSRQWFIRTVNAQDKLLERAGELTWHPGYMQSRFEDWTKGLNTDWLISRQRFFGVPIPVWFPIDANGEVDYDSPIVPSEDQLPIDPASQAPNGFTEDQRDQPGGFMGEADIMDTWATSSLTPQLATGWVDDADLHKRTFPMDMRPQGHDIIRTWLFSTVVRANYEHDQLPWQHAVLSGWILDPDRKKMSKSKGNVVTPTQPLDDHGADAVRYWATSARLGADTAIDENQMKVGRRLAIKLLNASKFVLSFPAAPDSAKASHPIDVALLSRLAQTVDEATKAFESYEYARALERTESFFWSYCDDFLELVKSRAYGSQGDDAAASANAALRQSLDVLCRLFAPFMPFVTEEVWSWSHVDSVHAQAWPTREELTADTDASYVTLSAAAAALADIRRAKSEAKVSQRATAKTVKIEASTVEIEAIKAAEADLREAGSIENLNLVPLEGGQDAAMRVEVELAQ
jgi:valyl-tRNA synthetase